MTALWVIFWVLLFLLILLLCPLSVSVVFKSELVVKIRYLFFHYQLYPRPEEPIKEQKKAAEKKEKNDNEAAKSKIRGILEQKGLSGFLDIIREFASIATGAAKKWFSHMVIDNIYMDITVADEDAAQAAILYGAVCSAVYAPLGIILNNFKCKGYHINVVPDFKTHECKIYFNFKAHMILLFLVSATLTALVQSLKLLQKMKKT
ncbi:MAG TPA: DUF2953 domain-containing protein [Caproiciproducens sp.]|nr:DUF2953 domain-containing protein [Caproiciproducens sp.]